MATQKERRATPRKPAAKAEPTPARKPSVQPEKEKPLSNEDLYKMVQETAYFKAKARGFEPGGEIQDWIEAEREVRERMRAGAP
jgi:hypothetical protein